MKKTNRIITALMAIVAGVVLLSGCAERMRNNQLEKVAKDWSLVIRSSQVIPVYPLTEDLQPGDVLLVSTPIEDQVKLYKKKGFLPLDQMQKRLNPTVDYSQFYLNRYDTAGGARVPPAQWQIVAAGKLQWDNAPHAAFPTYQFEVNTGSGMNLAIPIQGVPVALGLMHTGKAYGTVTIKDAYTFGLDNATLLPKIKEWADANRNMLRGCQPWDDAKGKKHYSFLRVVSRVYVASKMDVTLDNAQATSGEGGAGANLPVNLPAITDGTSAQNYANALQALNTSLTQQIPGFKAKFSVASSRSVTMHEEFTRPLVIGYVGFDIPILEGGRLGTPVSTLEQLTGTPVAPEMEGGNIYRFAAIEMLYSQLLRFEGEPVDRIKTDLDRLESLLPQTYPFTLYQYNSPTTITRSKVVFKGAAVGNGFRGVMDYLGNGRATVETLERYLPTAPQTTEEERAVVVEMKAELEMAQEAIMQVDKKLSRAPALARAVDLAMFGNQ